MRYSPAQVIAIEGLKESPFCCTFGCCETESVAKKVIAWLADNGDAWDTTLPDLTTFGTPWDLYHGHSRAVPPGVTCNFFNDYVFCGRVNKTFVDVAHTHCDGRRLRKDILHKLRPDLFPDPTHAH